MTEIKGKTTLSLDHPSQRYGYALLVKTLATHNTEFPAALLTQLLNASTVDGTVNEQDLNFKLAVIEGIQPRDQLESMLAAQMGVVHSTLMTMVSRMNNGLMLQEIELVGRQLNNLTRTFAMQIEALKRHRSTGEQKVTVEHVTINEGGKAIVGNVTHSGPGYPRSPRQSLERSLSIPDKPSLFCDFKADTKTMPSSCRERLDCLPVPWRTRRRAER